MTSPASLVNSSVASNVAQVRTGDRFSIPYIVLAALLIGGGIFTISLWILSFAWVDFVGVFLLAIGALMLFSPRAGADQAL
ncbi:MAG TPA: hypothetical protein VFG07_02445 [Thermoplasmata archaeon]|nr:hypothetical protein [Thermoplasmata archaeon]